MENVEELLPPIMEGTGAPRLILDTTCLMTAVEEGSVGVGASVACGATVSGIEMLTRDDKCIKRSVNCRFSISQGPTTHLLRPSPAISKALHTSGILQHLSL